MTHRLHALVVIAVLAVVCRADGWARVRLSAESKAAWLATFLDLPGGIRSHDTFGRVFARLDPDAFERCFTAWMGGVVDLAGGRLIAIDGKAIRRSFAHAWDRSGTARLVSAFVCQGGNRLAFAQLAVEANANETVAIPKLLALLDLTGAVALVVLVERHRQNPGDPTGKVTVERQLYICSLKAPAAATVAAHARGHWAVENNLHWQLDVSFAEDDRRVRAGHGAENFSRLGRVALNLLKGDATVKAGIKAKLLKAGWNHDYLLRPIQQ